MLHQPLYPRHSRNQGYFWHLLFILDTSLLKPSGFLFDVPSSLQRLTTLLLDSPSLLSFFIQSFRKDFFPLTDTGMPANTPLAFATSIRLTHNLASSLRELDWSVFSFVTTIQLTDGFDTRGSFLVCDLTCLKTLIVGDGCFSAPGTDRRLVLRSLPQLTALSIGKESFSFFSRCSLNSLIASSPSL